MGAFPRLRIGITRRREHCEQRGKELDIQSVSGPHDRQALESQEVMAFALSARAVCGDERRRRTLWRRGRVA